MIPSISCRLPRLLLGALLVTSAMPFMGPLPQANAQSVAAAPTNDAVSSPIRGLYDALRTAQTTGTTAQRRMVILSPAVDRAFDLEAILRRSVGYRYASLSNTDKARLLSSFRQFTIARYASSFKPGTGAVFTMLPQTRPNPTGGQIVDTTIGGGTDAATPIDYVMTQGPNGWRATDVLLDAHISQVAAQRADFSAALSQGGAPALADLLDSKTARFLHD
nr:ABC transporter substrate-binding protein [uncultured Neokomagataea sp.]